MNKYFGFKKGGYGINGILVGAGASLKSAYEMVLERGDDFIHDWEDFEDFAMDWEEWAVPEELDFYRDFADDEFVVVEWDDLREEYDD